MSNLFWWYVSSLLYGCEWTNDVHCLFGPDLNGVLNLGKTKEMNENSEQQNKILRAGLNETDLPGW